MSVLQAESATVICQRALGWAEHRGTFDSLEDGSTLARDCRLRYDIRRRALLEALDWRFARRRKNGTLVANVDCPADYPAAWSRPEECLRIRGVYEGSKLLTHVIEEQIFTPSVPAVQIVFTAEKDNPVLFPPVFTTALEFLLASEFSMVFARSVNRAEVMMQNFRRAMEQADEMEAAERTETEAYATGAWVSAIECGWMGGV